MKRIDRASAFGLVVSAWAGIVLVLVPGRASVVGHVWLVLVLAIGLVAAVGALLRSLPARRSAFDAAFAPRGQTLARPASLERVEREVALASGTAFDVHYRLRPPVSTVASGLLARRGVDLVRNPQRAQTMVGPELWDLIRPDRAAPDDRTAPGLPLKAIERVVDDLERL